MPVDDEVVLAGDLITEDLNELAGAQPADLGEMTSGHEPPDGRPSMLQHPQRLQRVDPRVEQGSQAGVIELVSLFHSSIIERAYDNIGPPAAVPGGSVASC